MNRLKYFLERFKKEIDSKYMPSTDRKTSSLYDNPPPRLGDLSHLFFTSEYDAVLSGGRYREVFEPVAMDCSLSGSSNLCLSFLPVTLVYSDPSKIRLKTIAILAENVGILGNKVKTDDASHKSKLVIAKANSAR